MDVVVDFQRRDPSERLRMWQLHLPHDHGVDESFLQKAASRCPMEGGQIRNAALQATLVALDEATGQEKGSDKESAAAEGVTVLDEHVVAAVREEYQKDGAVCPLTIDEETIPNSGAQQFVEGMPQ